MLKNIIIFKAGSKTKSLYIGQSIVCYLTEGAFLPINGFFISFCWRSKGVNKLLCDNNITIIVIYLPTSCTSCKVLLYTTDHDPSASLTTQGYHIGTPCLIKL